MSCNAGGYRNEVVDVGRNSETRLTMRGSRGVATINGEAEQICPGSILSEKL